MTLPTFLGIGVPRGGSTWLHALLASHPEIYMPARRKEIRFFDRDYQRGVSWYESFFPPEENDRRYRAIGEISPQYYADEKCPDRIFRTLPDCKLLIILRHPIDRAYSVYGFHVQRRGFTGSFGDFLASRPDLLEEGIYSKYLKRYLHYFDTTRLLTLLFEDAVSNTERTKVTIADFLDIDPGKFPAAAGRAKINASSAPKHRFLYSAAARVGHQLQRWHLDGVVDFVRRSNFERLLAKGPSLHPLDQALKARLSKFYDAEFHDLQCDFDLDLSSWNVKN